MPKIVFLIYLGEFIAFPYLLGLKRKYTPTAEKLLSFQWIIDSVTEYCLVSRFMILFTLNQESPSRNLCICIYILSVLLIILTDPQKLTKRCFDFILAPFSILDKGNDWRSYMRIVGGSGECRNKQACPWLCISCQSSNRIHHYQHTGQSW